MTGKAEAEDPYHAVSRIFISHPKFERVHAPIKALIELGRAVDEAQCIHLSGPPGVGKTTLRRQLAQEFPPITDGREVRPPMGPTAIADYIPLLQFEMPPKVTVKSLCMRMLQTYGDIHWSRGDEFMLTERLSKYIDACGTRAIFADEAQRAVDSRGVVVGEHIVDWFKYLHGRHGIPLIFSGLARLRHLFQQDQQIERRWDAELRLEPYFWKTRDGKDHLRDQEVFIAILSAFSEYSPLPFDLDVQEDDVAFRFYYASRGVIGTLKKLLKKSMLIARAEPKRFTTINFPLLTAAFDEAFRRELHGMENPFERNFRPVLPPPLPDDGEQLPPPEKRRETKTKAMKKLEAQIIFSKGN